MIGAHTHTWVTDLISIWTAFVITDSETKMAIEQRSKLVVPLTYEVSEWSRARSELGERYRVTLLEVTLDVVLLMSLKTTTRCAAAIWRQAHPYPRATDRTGICLSVLLVHDDIDDRIHTWREVQQQISQNVTFWNSSILGIIIIQKIKL